MGLEDCVRANRVPVWENVWEEEGRRYKMEKCSNQAGVFIRCSVRDSGGKSYSLMFSEGKGVVGGWRMVAENLRQLGVRSSEEIQREEKSEKMQREDKRRRASTKLLPRLLKPTLSPLAEVRKLEKIADGKGVYVKVGEEEVRERLDQLSRCLVGWWGSGPSQIPGVDSVRRWAITQWNIKNSFAVVNLGRGLWLFEFESKEEVDRVLMYGKRRFGTNLVHLRIWGEDMGCSSQGDSEEKAWVRVVGLPVHLWSKKVMEKIGDACGGFLAVDEDTDKLGELGWARILVKLKKSEPPNTIEVAVGGATFRMQLWWELSPFQMTVSSPDQRSNPSSNREDDGDTRAGERVSFEECEAAGGDVGDKHPVLSSQTQWRSSGQTSSQSSGHFSGQFSDRISGKVLGQSPGQSSDQYTVQEVGKRVGWAFQPNLLSDRATDPPFRQKGGLGLHMRNILSPNPGPITGTKALLQKKRGPQVKPAQPLSTPFYAGVEGGMNPDVEKQGEETAETKLSQLQLESQSLEAPVVEPDLLNRFEISIPVDKSPSLSVFGQPLFQGGSSGLGGLHVLGEEEEGILPLEIVAENETKGGFDHEGMMVEYGQEEGLVEATPLAVEGYENWEDNMLVKFSEFLGFATEGFETQIVDLMRQMVKNQNK